jgi:hypothetical protein
MRTLTDKAYIAGATLIASITIYLAWDRENGIPMMQFALTFGGCLLGHVLTIVLDDTTDTQGD